MACNTENFSFGTIDLLTATRRPWRWRWRWLCQRQRRWWQRVGSGGGCREANTIPYSVLLMKLRLQPCGVMTAYRDTLNQLDSEGVLFRNLDGNGDRTSDFA